MDLLSPILEIIGGILGTIINLVISALQPFFDMLTMIFNLLTPLLQVAAARCARARRVGRGGVDYRVYVVHAFDFRRVNPRVSGGYKQPFINDKWRIATDTRRCYRIITIAYGFTFPDPRNYRRDFGYFTDAHCQRGKSGNNEQRF